MAAPQIFAQKPQADTPVEVIINRRLLNDFSKNLAEKVSKKEVDLNANFKVVAEGFLNSDGKLDISIDKKTKQPRSRIITAEGDPKMIQIAVEAIAGISDSGWLGYLQAIGINKINFTFGQNDEQLSATLTSEQPTPERARTLSSNMHSLLAAVLLMDKIGTKKLGDDEKILIQAMDATANEKLFVLNFSLSKSTAQELMKREIQKELERENAAKADSSGASAIKDH